MNTNLALYFKDMGIASQLSWSRTARMYFVRCPTTNKSAQSCYNGFKFVCNRKTFKYAFRTGSSPVNRALKKVGYIKVIVPCVTECRLGLLLDAGIQTSTIFDL